MKKKKNWAEYMWVASSLYLVLGLFNILFAWVVVTPWIAQFSFGFYSMMLTSTLIGLISMYFFKPRSWCVYCPMGTMTQGICVMKDKVN